MLGNHDLALIRSTIVDDYSHDTTLEVLRGRAELEEFIAWLCCQPLAVTGQTRNVNGADGEQQPFLLTHAGAWPGWSVDKLLFEAQRISDMLRQPDLRVSLAESMFKAGVTHPEQRYTVDWEFDNFVIDAFTRMRMLHSDQSLDFTNPSKASRHSQRWFDAPRHASLEDWLMIFGHWSQLGFQDWRAERNLLALDDGCVWGGRLVAVCLDAPDTRIAIDSRSGLRPG